MNSKLFKSLTFAMAYVGVIVGAGFASGQEVLQYFVSFGKIGIAGAILATILFAVTGKAILELGSFYLAYEHSTVLDKIAPKWLSKVIDVCLIVSCLGIGLVMIAGAGANLNQQFGLPLWLGSVVLSLVIIACGFLNVERVTQVIGAITPFLIVFLVAISIYSILGKTTPMDELQEIAVGIPNNLYHWIYSGFNYVGMNLMTGFAMAVVMGGDEINLKTASRGGLFGGLICGILITISTIALLFQVDIIVDSNMPFLALVNNVSPILGIMMSVIIFGMIFNTGTGVFYGLAARLSRNNPNRFSLYVIISVIIGYLISNVGFKTLMAYLYPIIGAAGMLLIFILFYVEFKFRTRFKHEATLREQLYPLYQRVKSKTATPEEEAQYRALLNDSTVDEKDRLIERFELEA